jgi:uncharacterized protein
MSEYINNKEKRLEGILQFSLGIMNEEDGSALYNKYKEALDYITPHDILEIEDRQLSMGIKPKQIKKFLEKVLNVLYHRLREYKWEKPEEGHTLYYFMQENRELEKVLNKIKGTLKKKDFTAFKIQVEKLIEFENHYSRKENVLFPYLERAWENYKPLMVMWSLHDDIRLIWKKLLSDIEAEGEFNAVIFKDIGELFFLMYGMIFKEELVVYPIAMETLDKYTWDKIRSMEAEIGYSYIEVQEFAKIKQTEKPDEFENPFSKILQSETGILNEEQVFSIFDTLPLDLTYIDKNDEVKYFSNPDERFFPRSPAIIGRKVQNCHPPESVHIVEKILDAFKKGEKSEADFWIQMKGKFIYIRYFAVKDKKDKYIGTIEVSQDITDIKKLEGEKRLLDWK